MVMAIPLDLVAEVRCFFGRDRASSNAYRRIRSTPLRVKTVSWITISFSVPSKARPPIEEYSPSLFSRTTQKSMSPGLRSRSGEGTPSISRTGRMFAYCWNSRRIGIKRPQSETWSGTPGNPTAPR